MLIESEELKKRLRIRADADWDGAFDSAVGMVEEMESETFDANVTALRDELARATGECGNQINHCGTIFTCREKGYHRIHDDHEQTDGTPMRWMDTSLGRLKPEVVDAGPS